MNENIVRGERAQSVPRFFGEHGKFPTLEWIGAGKDTAVIMTYPDGTETIFEVGIDGANRNHDYYTFPSQPSESPSRPYGLDSLEDFFPEPIPVAPLRTIETFVLENPREYVLPVSPLLPLIAPHSFSPRSQRQRRKRGRQRHH